MAVKSICTCNISSHPSAEQALEKALICCACMQMGGRDTQMYERAGLLTDRTVMAHGVTLTTQELQLLARRGSAIAHCPLSNFFFADVPLDVLKCLDLGVKAGFLSDLYKYA